MFQESIFFLVALSTIIQTTRNFVAFCLPLFANPTLQRWMGCPNNTIDIGIYGRFAYDQFKELLICDYLDEVNVCALKLMELLSL